MGFPKTLAALGVLLCLAGPLSAEEGGAGDYIPGLYASLINITPNKPGFALGTGYLFYTGNVGTSATLPFGGILASKISADVSLADLSLTYTFRPTFLGAHYTVSLSIPYVWVDVEAKVSPNPRLFPSIIGNRTKTVSVKLLTPKSNENTTSHALAVGGRFRTDTNRHTECYLFATETRSTPEAQHPCHHG
jgi:hypothetical protein